MFRTNRACSAGRGRGRAPRAEEVHLPAATSGVSQQQDARPVRLRSGAATQPRPGARTGHRALSGRASAGAVSGAVWPRQKPSGAGAGPLRAVRQGVDVTFATCTQLTAALNAARATGGYERKLANLARVSLLIIDDFGLKPLRPPADEDLHELMAERYESAATIATSNLDLVEWDQAFPANKLLSSATLDRMRHNAYCLVLDGKSYRASRKLPAVIRQRLASEAETACSSASAARRSGVMASTLGKKGCGFLKMTKCRSRPAARRSGLRQSLPGS